MTTIRIIIADDHKIFRDGIHSLISTQSDIEVVGEASNGEEVLEVLKNTPADIVLMDIDMPKRNGIETTGVVVSQHPNVKVLALSMHQEASYVMKMLDAGATGFLLKNAGTEDMIAAIKAVHAGNSFYSNEVSMAIIEALKKPEKFKRSDIPLTKRELEVLQLIAEEYSNTEIAEMLFISTRTVDTHRRNLLEKLELKNTASLVKYAIKHGLITSE